MVEPLLFNIDRTDSTYLEARRLLNLLNSFIAIPETDVPSNSILREFIGHSCFTKISSHTSLSAYESLFFYKLSKGLPFL